MREPLTDDEKRDLLTALQFGLVMPTIGLTYDEYQRCYSILFPEEKD
jgi:hypothetical protein